MIREIWLTDKDNVEKFDFQNFGTFFFTSPTSLGIYRNKSFLIVNNQRIEVEDVPSFKNITATIMIKASNKELESKYSLLRDFISKHIKNGFRLYIKTEENKNARYINCAIDSLDKTEKTTANTMLVPINILPKSLWLGDVSGVSVVKAVNQTGLFQFTEKTIRDKQVFSASFTQRDLIDIYGNAYYSIAFGSGAISQIFIFNGGEETTPLVIRIYGQATNPYVFLKDLKTGEVLQSVGFHDLEIESGSYLEINSNPDGAYIEIVNETTNERRDVEAYANENTKVYMDLPVGSYLIETTDESEANAVQTRVFFTNQYKGA